MASLFLWKAQIQPRPWDLSECVYGCPNVYESVCKGVEGDYGGAFTLSGQRDGSASSLAPPIPDHSPGISGLLSHTFHSFKPHPHSPCTEPKSSEPPQLCCSFSFPLTYLVYPNSKFLLLLPPLFSERDFWCGKTAREQFKEQLF